MVRIAGATFSFGELSLEEAARVLAGLGFACADVGAGWSDYHQVMPQEAADDPQAQADRVRRVTERHRLAVSELFVMHFGKPIDDPDPQVRAWTRRMFAGITRFARLAGFESVMMIPGHVHEELGQTAEEAFDLSAEELRYMVAAAEDQGLQCNVEPCIGSIAQYPVDALRLAQAVPGLGLTVDYAHQVQLGLAQADIEVLHPYARHFHAKQSSPGAFQARPDEGAVDFGRLMRKLEAEGYQGVICVEFVTKQELLDAGWDFVRETARLKQILEEESAATQ